MQLIAHRGLKNEFIKENTLEAFMNAIKNKYAGIELDLRLTKDNKIVVIHDSLINRTSNGTGKVKNYTYKELLKYNFGTENCKAFIPKLETVIKKISNTIIFIELKEEINKKDLENILKKNKTNTYYIFSYNKKYIEKLYGINYKLGLINYVYNSNSKLENIDFILILDSLVNKDIINYLNAKNIELVMYNIFSKNKFNNKEYINKFKYII